MLNRIALYVLGAALLSAATFFGTRMIVINKAPVKVMETIEGRIVAGAGGWNACFHNRTFGPRANAARRANPDSIISSMAYDLSHGADNAVGKTCLCLP